VRLVLAGFAAVLLLAALPDRAASMSCAAALVVDGRLLMGHGGVEARRLPPRERSVAAIEPGCSADDRPTTVWTLRGVPPEVAVVHGSDLYVAEGSLTALADHPLHAVSSRRPARRKSCAPRSPLRGTVSYAGGDGIALVASGRELWVEVDARSRMANRPAHQPVVTGQRLVVRASKCRRRTVADRIAFEGATMHPERVALRLGDDGGMPLWLVLVAAMATLGLAVAAVERWTRPPRRRA
jgi:hypothetical protein